MSYILGRKVTYQAIILVIGIFMIAVYYVQTPETEAFIRELMKWASTVAGVLGLYGGITALKYHGLRASKEKGADRIWSAYVVALIAVVAFTGIVLGKGSGPYRWISTNVLVTLDTTLYMSIGFTLVAATLTGLRARNVPTGIMVVVVVIMVLRQTPIFLVAFPWLLPVGDFIQLVMGTACARAQAIGVGIAAFFLGLRILSGREIGWLGVRELE